MNDRIRLVSIVCLTVVACVALGVAGILSAHDKEPPPYLMVAIATAVGAIAAITPAMGQKQ